MEQHSKRCGDPVKRNQSKTNECSKCSKIFSRRDALHRHIKYVECAPSCMTCSQVFNNQAELTHHLRRCTSPDFTCSTCPKVFSNEGELKRHLREDGCGAGGSHITPSFSCNSCGSSYVNAEDLMRHVTECRRHTEEGLVVCKPCGVRIPSGKHAAHLRTLAHRDASRTTIAEGVELVDSAFKCRIATYRITPREHHVQVESFMEEVGANLRAQIILDVQRHGSIKANLELAGLYYLERTEEKEVKTFQTKNQIITRGTNMDEYSHDLRQIFEKKTQEFAERESGKCQHINCNG